MLRQRVITACVLAIVLSLAVIFLPVLGLSLVFMVLLALAAWEWARMSGLQYPWQRTVYCMVFIGSILLVGHHSQILIITADTDKRLDLLGITGLWWAFALLWVMGYPASTRLWGSRAVRLIMGLLVLVPTWLALISLRQMDYGIGLIFVLFGLVSAADIGAYFTGRRFGHAKLAPRVSPAKSWAGFWGGLLASVIFMLVISFFWKAIQLPFIMAVVIALFTALASVLGDLFESMVKRHAGIKDSGTILPGHGGIMDRVDSMTAAAPVFALLILLAVPQ